VDDYVEISGGASMQLFGSSFTISAWLNTTDSVDAYNGIFVRTGGSGAQYVLNGGSGLQRVEHNVGTFNSNTVINDGQWHHILVVYDTSDSNRVTFYLDGITDGTTTNITFTTAPDKDYLIGSDRIIGAGHNFDGIIDEVAIYSEALSISQIQKLYAEGLPQHQLTQHQ